MGGRGRGWLAVTAVAVVLAMSGSALAVEGDLDDDGVPDIVDNCELTPNPDQADSDGNGIGDACDHTDDPDGDGVPNDEDNCDAIANPEQTDSDNDGLGDACDPDHFDSDNDTILDGVDNCTAVFNPDQVDTDGDGAGNRCDSPAVEVDGVLGNQYAHNNCYRRVIPRNDDQSDQVSEQAFLPQQLDFFGLPYTRVFVNNNGNITFDQALSTFTPFAITADTPPIIAPFLADIDTRPPTGGQVSYGVVLNSPLFGGRNVFCAQWEHVGYFSSKVDKRNTIQLLLVDRGDTGPGNFDIYFNYANIDWETGDASGGTNGLGGTSAGAGYSSGTGDPNGFLQLSCSLVNGACLDSNASTGLANTSTNSLLRGRHIFEIRNGGQTFGGSIRGTVEDDGVPEVNALVQVCRRTDDGLDRCRTARTIATGEFIVSNLEEGDYRVRAIPAGNQIPVTVEVEDLGPTEQRVLDIDVEDGVPPLHGTTFGRPLPGSFIPHGNSGQPITLRTEGCNDAVATYTITHEGSVVAAGGMVKDGEVFTAEVVVDVVGPVRVLIQFDGECGDISFDAYIDPSGFVVDQDGDPVVGATVTLLRADAAVGPFAQVPDGSNVMSPSNRTNPDATDDTGHFGWDVLAGFYRVRATAPGCSTVETAVLTIPPPVTDLLLQLQCGGGTSTGAGAGQGPEPAAQDACPPGALAAAGAGVTDIAASAHRAAIECILAWGLSQPGSEFRPDQAITRGQAAAMLARLVRLALVTIAVFVDAFDDDDGHVFEPDLDLLALLGVLTGDGERRVHPDELVSRAQLAALVVRAVAVITGTPLPPADNPFPDVGGLLADAVARAAGAGLLVGHDDGSFDPTGTSLRAHVATVLVRLLQLLVDDAGLRPL